MFHLGIYPRWNIYNKRKYTVSTITNDAALLIAYLFHAAANTWTRVFAIDHRNATVTWILACLIALTAIIVVVTTGAQNLSRTHERIQEEN